MDLDFRVGIAEATVGLAYKCKLLMATLHWAWGTLNRTTYLVVNACLSAIKSWREHCTLRLPTTCIHVCTEASWPLHVQMYVKTSVVHSTLLPGFQPILCNCEATGYPVCVPAGRVKRLLLSVTRQQRYMDRSITKCWRKRITSVVCMIGRLNSPICRRTRLRGSGMDAIFCHV